MDRTEFSMDFIRTSIDHDHIYSSSNCSEKKCVDNDRTQRRRTSNNISSRISRVYRRTKLEILRKKSREYEESNEKLRMKISFLIKIIDRLKDQLKNLVNNSRNDFKENIEHGTYWKKKENRSIGLVREKLACVFFYCLSCWEIKFCDDRWCPAGHCFLLFTRRLMIMINEHWSSEPNQTIVYRYANIQNSRTPSARRSFFFSCLKWTLSFMV